MSASPAGGTPGRTPGRTPNGGPAPMMRRPKMADPLVRPKDKQKRRHPRPPPVLPLNGQHIPHMNGMKPPAHSNAQATSHSMAPQVARPNPQPIPSLFAPQASSENLVSGFSSKPVAQSADYPLFMSKRALMEGFRYHVARFSARRPIDPRNTEEFVRPVRLHRRDPRAPAPGVAAKSEDTPMGGTDAADDTEKEKEEILRAQREAKKEAEAALVAPAVNSGGQRRLGAHLKKTEQVYRNDQTDEQKAHSKLRYEEALPWHLEDFDNKSTWVGNYEAALSDTYAMMVQGQDGAFRIMPLEKWYKFTQKNQFKTLTIEEAETRYNKKVKEPRWFMDSEENKKKRQEQEHNKKASSNLFIGKWDNDGGEAGVAAPAVKQENADADDLDFTEDRFADDEENMLFESDAETKEAEERIKKDQLQANIFDLKEEKEYEKQERLEKKEKEAEKKLGKHVKKALMKREKNYIYDSDSTDNPYTSESDSDSTETERLKEAEKAKAEAANKTTPDSKDKNSLSTKSKDPTRSGASSKGTNTPSHRPSKHPSPNPGLSRTASSTSLKRPGSPLASDVSGNESAARKKMKKKHAAQTSSSQSNLQPPSRPGSPPHNSTTTTTTNPPNSSAPQSRIPPIPSKRPRNPTAAGSGSDSEGRGAASGGEMSDGTRKRIKLKLGMPSSSNPNKSANGTASNSRACSPEVPPPHASTLSRSSLSALDPPAQPTLPHR